MQNYMPVSVLMGNRRVGSIYYSEARGKGISVFSYSPEWIASGFPLLPSMPLEQTQYFSSAELAQPNAVFPSVVSDGMPDSWGRIALRKTEGDPPISFLLDIPDVFRQGALRYQVNEWIFGDRHRHSVEIEDIAAAARAIENGTDSKDSKAIMEWYGSASGGARPKANVLVDGQLYLAKFTALNETKQTEATEVMTLNLAKLCGINAAPARCLSVGRYGDVALIRRFDRDGDKRVHYASAHSFLDAESYSTLSYVEMADIMLRTCENPIANTRELFRRIAFTCLMSNSDDHLRNHGFLHTEGGWNLSPMFDVNPDVDRGRSIQLKTPISIDGDCEASLKLLIENADYFHESNPEAVIGEIARVITCKWKDVARASGVTNLRQVERAIEHSEMNFARSCQTSRYRTSDNQVKKDSYEP